MRKAPGINRDLILEGPVNFCVNVLCRLIAYSSFVLVLFYMKYKATGFEAGARK